MFLRSNGIRGAQRFPHTKELKCGRELKEFPPSTIRFWRMTLPVAGGGYLRLLAYEITAWAIRRINEVARQPAMVYLHPWELDIDQTQIAAPWLSKFRHYQNLNTTEKKCAKLLEDFSWAPMEKILSAQGIAAYREGNVTDVF